MADNFKEERNDRQIILWGEQGQHNVDNAHIVVLGSDCVVSEFLKNIVLHGFGHVTIIDDAIVNKEDLMSNFLVDANDLGKPRAESVANLLKELNEDIEVNAKVQSPADLSFFNQDPKPGFVVTCGNLKPSYLAEVNKLCRANRIPQGHVQSVGLFGAFYIDAGIHEIFKGPSSGDSPHYELRTVNPFPELEKFFNSFDFNDQSTDEFYHVPSPAVIHKVRTQLVKEGKFPKLPGAQVRVIKSILNSQDFDHDPLHPKPGIEEAKAKCTELLMTGVPPNPLKVFKLAEEHPEIKDPFFEMARACGRFYKKHEEIPHYGGLPDLETSTKNYLQLKKIYEDKSEQDWEEIRKDLAEHNVKVDEDIFRYFLKNVFRVDAIQYQPILHSLGFLPAIMPNPNAVLTVQCLFTAIRNFYETNGRQPENTEADKKALIADISQHVENPTEVSNYVEEFALSQNHIVPSVAATIGAIFAEEVTKVIIHQAKPVKGAFIYNGVTCNGVAYS